MYIKKAKRIVIKIGSSLLFDEKEGKFNYDWLRSLASDISRLRKEKKEVILVSSGAILSGKKQLDIKQKNIKLDMKQAISAIGQIHLMQAYQMELKKYKILTAQVLLTLDDTEQRRRSLNARNTIVNLLNIGAIPIVNENDTTTTTEIRYGDNDRLAARIAQISSADCLILLSNIDGLYKNDPSKNRNAKFIPKVEKINKEIEAMASNTVSAYGSGGMVTKISAAKTAMSSGCHMVISSGKIKNPIKAIINGSKCTWFIPSRNPLTARKQWIVGSMQPPGNIIVDKGAASAIQNKKSLLPAGITKVEGNFERGDSVIIKKIDGTEIARGLTNYSSKDAKLLVGKKSQEIKKILGYSGREELIHKDNLVRVL
jgi:glutamate 5-kinase|tara:strand:+ start:315 stop:1427 length:1113 start_codon:yes stop_codon:yes gene_type:complete